MLLRCCSAAVKKRSGRSEQTRGRGGQNHRRNSRHWFELQAEGCYHQRERSLLARSLLEVVDYTSLKVEWFLP